ncbi:PucR family transcriptional regulator [Patulibacter minatonensis]|uniref:PucR family transcriptional regulator n=1 Tax=Patulibacter minatonensis TaxID=298163 RepID=UPI000478885A|nr:helix-turn-helix domain-containing protein [Patulibacter minatonensis]
MSISTAPDQSTVLATVQDLAHGLLPEVQPFAELVTQGVLDRVPELAPPGFAGAFDAITESCAQMIGGLLSTLAYGFSPRTAEPPLRTRQVYDRLIEAGGDVHTLQRAYRVGHRVIWQRWSAHVCAHVTDPDVRAAVLDLTSDHIFEYLDTASERHVTDDRARLQGARPAVSPAELVSRMLDGGEEPTTAQLGYELRVHHVAVVVTPLGGDALPRRAMEAVLAHAGGRPLVVPAGDGGWWAWVGAHDDADLEALAGRMAGTPSPRVLVGIGDPGFGPEGLRRSHAEALEVVRLLRHAHPPRAGAVRHRDVAHAALLASDPARARGFARHQLAGLATDDETTAMLRDTVRTLFAANSPTAAARELGVHHKTISYRVRQAERLLGRPLAPNRRDIEAALLIEETISCGEPHREPGG